ncbi:RNA polymerase sigma factor [Anaerolentibacter hominis]|uniref:RNA polymerase sigma factor n=1 Tax=Anaerolentibacter hominis TaxID=3079009 RepID=UPI0031B87364
MTEDTKDVRAFQAGDQSAFERLVLRYKNNLIYFINRYVKDLYEAEDLAQDTFVELLLHKERIRPEMNFKTYLFAIGRNKAVDHCRRYGRISPEEWIGQPDPDWEEWLGKKLIREEEKQLVHSALGKLKEDYRVILTLADLEELPYKEIAAILHKSMPQVKVGVHRARKKLAEILQREGYTYEK